MHNNKKNALTLSDSKYYFDHQPSISYIDCTEKASVFYNTTLFYLLENLASLHNTGDIVRLQVEQ